MDEAGGHARWVRVSHWIGAASLLVLAVTGFVILMAHPRLYWGEVGNGLTPALIELPISRNYRHGGFTCEAIESRRQVWDILRAARESLATL